MSLLCGLLAVICVHSKSDEKLRLTVYKELLIRLQSFKTENQRQLNHLSNKDINIHQLKKTRIEFKKAEYFLGIGNLIEYRKINGPNLRYDSYSGGASQIFEGQGLQKMEELILENNFDSLAYKNEILLLNELLEKIIERGNKLEKIPESSFHQIIWEALRFEIFRIEALGMTGFDTPISNWGIEEIDPALEGIKRMIRLYKGSKWIDNTDYYKFIQSLQKAQRFAKKNTDFENFDRLEFSKNYLHPISLLFQEIQTKNQWHYPVRNTGVNHHAKHLWDRQFFNEDMFRPMTTSATRNLGEKLFNDKNLSPLKNMSCATCHQPSHGFAEPKAKSVSALGKQLERNTPSLWNVAFQTKFFLDGRILKIQDQIFEVIHNPDEMNSNLDYILSYIESNESYIELFEKAFKRAPNKQDILFALEAYIRQLVSYNSRFDQYMRGENGELSKSEKRGFNLFAGKAKCATCHFMPLFNGLLAPYYDETEFEVLGTPSIIGGKVELSGDLGRYRKTQIDIHERAFKTTGIRNSHLSPPYMHNGVFDSLEEVLAFYNNGGGLGSGLPIKNQTLVGDSLRLNKQEIADIIAFIHSLEDTNRIRN